MNESLLHHQNKKTKRDARPMQAIHIDEHVYNVRRDGLLDAGSNAGGAYFATIRRATA